MGRDLEKDLIEIECAIKSQEEKDNTFTVSVLERCHELVSELKNYKDLEDQGRLLQLPCAVGDTVYADSEVFGILEYVVDNIVIGETITYQCSAYLEAVGDCPSECLDEIEPDISNFGKSVFLTREEAEATLKALEG